MLQARGRGDNSCSVFNVFDYSHECWEDLGVALHLCGTRRVFPSSPRNVINDAAQMLCQMKYLNLLGRASMAKLAMRAYLTGVIG